MWFFNCQMMFAILIFDLPIEFFLFCWCFLGVSSCQILAWLPESTFLNCEFESIGTDPKKAIKKNKPKAHLLLNNH
jgi:hypothetical protein